MSSFWVVGMALLLDHFLGEPKRFHPLIGFGHYAGQIEARLNSSADSEQKKLLLGILATVLVVLPFFLLAQLLKEVQTSIVVFIFEAVILYFAIGMRSLNQHAKDIYQALQQNDLPSAKQRVSLIVSRDTESMETSDISRATIESILENGSDAVYAPIFWYLLAGIPGVIVYRAINTLDAMWGYKTERFKSFGFAAARIDDILNYIPARLTALSYALMGHWQEAIFCWKNQAQQWHGINPGAVMAAGSGALDLKIGGGDFYHGHFKQRPILGRGEIPQPSHIDAALDLLKRVIGLWLGVLAIIYLPIV